jgi:RIP metalloprotease RseP
LIFTHELGHFSAAKKFGIRVDEFGFGFPPKLLSFKKGETEYSINLIPIGGFVKIFGENSDEESESGPDNARSMIHKPRYIQAVVLAAGVFLNLVLAWGLFSASLFIGMPVALADLPAGAQIKEERLHRQTCRAYWRGTLFYRFPMMPRKSFCRPPKRCKIFCKPGKIVR